MRHLSGQDKLTQCLQFAASGGRTVMAPSAHPNEDALQLAEAGRTDDELMLAAHHRLEDAAGTSAEVKRGEQDIGVEDHPHSGSCRSARPAATPNGAGDLLVGEVARGGAGLAIREQLVPAAAPIRVLPEGLSKELAAGAALLHGEAIHLVGEFDWK